MHYISVRSDKSIRFPCCEKYAFKHYCNHTNTFCFIFYGTLESTECSISWETCMNTVNQIFRLLKTDLKDVNGPLFNLQSLTLCQDSGSRGLYISRMCPALHLFIWRFLKLSTVIFKEIEYNVINCNHYFIVLRLYLFRTSEQRANNSPEHLNSQSK